MADTRIPLLGSINPLLQAINQNNQGLARAQIAGAGFNQRNQALDLQRQGLDQRGEIARVNQAQADQGLDLRRDKLGLEREKFDFDPDVAAFRADIMLRSIEAITALKDPAGQDAFLERIRPFFAKNLPDIQLPEKSSPEFIQSLRNPELIARLEAIGKDPQTAALQLKQGVGPDGKPVFFPFDPAKGGIPEGVRPAPKAGPKSGAGGIKLTDIAGLRKEFTSQAKTFVNVRDSFGKVKKAAESGSAASDLSMIFNFMKMLDPGSVVREGEFANAQNTTGIPGRILNTYNNLAAGNRLNPGQRAEFLAAAEDIFKSVTQSQLLLEDQFRKQAELAGIDPNRVVIDFFGKGRPEQTVTKRFRFNAATGELEPQQ